MNGAEDNLLTSVSLDRPVVILLSGPPGAGKLTIGSVVASRLGLSAVLLDNHSFSGPILAVARANGVRPVPGQVWTYATRIKDIVLEAAGELAPPDTSFVFTTYLVPGEHDASSVTRLAAFAERRGTIFIPVALSCPVEELVRRVANDDRRSRSKLIDPGLLQALLERGILVPEHENLLSLNSGELTPNQAADHILRHVAALASL